MNTPSISDRLSAFITQEFLVDFTNEVNAETDLFEEELIDSFGFIELVSFIESEFGVQMSDEDMVAPDIGSLAGLARLVEARITEKV